MGYPPGSISVGVRTNGGYVACGVYVIRAQFTERRSRTGLLPVVQSQRSHANLAKCRLRLAWRSRATRFRRTTERSVPVIEPGVELGSRRVCSQKRRCCGPTSLTALLHTVRRRKSPACWPGNTASSAAAATSRPQSSKQLTKLTNRPPRHGLETNKTSLHRTQCDSPTRAVFGSAARGNSNGLLRQYLSQGQTMRQLISADLDAVHAKLNTRPVADPASAPPPLGLRPVALIA